MGMLKKMKDSWNREYNAPPSLIGNLLVGAWLVLLVLIGGCWYFQGFSATLHKWPLWLGWIAGIGLIDWINDWRCGTGYFTKEPPQS